MSLTSDELRAQLGNVFTTGVESPPKSLNGDDDLTPFPSPNMGSLKSKPRRLFLCIS